MATLPMMPRWLAAMVLALCCVLLAVPRAHADPREVESADYKDDFGDEYEDRLTRAGEADQRLQFELEHNIPSADGRSAFTKRGRVEILFSAASLKPKVTFHDLPALSDADVAHLEGLLRANRHYTIRARADPENPQSTFVMTSIPMCMLAGTRMREDLSFHLSDSGKLMAIEYLTPYVGPAACSEYQKRSLKSVKFGAAGNVLKEQNGPSPPKQLIPKQKKAPKMVKNPTKAEDGGEPPAEENQSFLRRYWYIILPLVLLSLFGGDPGPQNAQANAAGGGGGAGAGGGAARRR